MPATHTPGAFKPNEQAALELFAREGLRPYAWQNGPYYQYAPHSHPYRKVLVCTRGSIRFDLPREGSSITLQPGDRLDLEPGTEHAALVGPNGVTCLEAQR